MADLPDFDKSTFTNQGYIKRVEKPWGYELHFVPEGMPYMGKVLHIDAGKRLSLQAHDKKQETYWLVNGECNLIIENKNGELETIKLEKGKGYTTMIGQRHRHQAVTDCDVIEVSTPETGTTWRIEDDYARPDETEEQRKKERGEI
ncbi:MAG: cupin [Candidatus Levybacteria bacterium]|nr:cupin [Candidatus Levybacteria bacterium]